MRRRVMTGFDELTQCGGSQRDVSKKLVFLLNITTR
jgi:hypothetical protein